MQWGKVKQKLHTETYPEPWDTDIFSELRCIPKPYLESWYIQNQFYIQRPLKHLQSAFHVLYFQKCHRFFNIGLVFTPEVFILRKKVWGSGRARDEGRDFRCIKLL